MDYKDRDQGLKMSLNKIILMCILLVGLGGCVAVSPTGVGYDIRVPLRMINSTVTQHFPQSNDTGYGTLLIHTPTILGKQGSDKLAVGTSFTFSNLLIPKGIKGSVNLSSGIRYNPQNKGLYLDRPMLDELAFQNFSLSSYLTSDMRQAIGDMIAKALMKQPIYKMDIVGASFVKSMRVDNGNILLHIGL